MSNKGRRPSVDGLIARMETGLSLNEDSRGKARRRSCADIKLNLDSTTQQNIPEIHMQHYVGGGSSPSLPPSRHGSCDDVHLAPHSMTASRSSMRSRRVSIAVDDVSMLKFAATHDDGDDKRKSLLEKAMQNQHLSEVSLKRPRRASLSHFPPIKSASSNTEHVSDSVIVARKLFGEIDKQKRTDSAKAAMFESSSAHIVQRAVDVPDHSKTTPPGWQEFKENILKAQLCSQPETPTDVSQVTRPISRPDGRRISQPEYPESFSPNRVASPIRRYSDYPRHLYSPTARSPLSPHMQRSNHSHDAGKKNKMLSQKCDEQGRQLGKDDSHKSNDVTTIRPRSSGVISPELTGSPDRYGSRRTEERLKHRNSHTLKLQQMLKTLEEQMPTQALLELRQLREENKHK